TARYYGGANTFWHPAPIVDIAATSTNGGYWLVASDGAIYSFGTARYYGGANTASGSDAMQPVSGTVTGVLSNRCGSYDADHYGIDIGTGTATPPISATAGGTVIARNYDSGQGNYVYIRHNNGYVSRYLHLSKFADGLAVGQVKARGDVIGYVGTTGNSTGNHLHFEMRKDGTVVNMSSAYKCGQTVTRGQPIPFSFPGI
ncbi:MAG: M23 family metallopeptidase, partial [Chloroflexota bacterium]|nr:M23 family metallopeptidase [Chloroflexota bacterium]